MKLVLNESLEERMKRAEKNFKLKEAVYEDLPDELENTISEPAQEIKNEEEISNAAEPEEVINRGLADMINELIKSEYDAITDYNNAIATIVAENQMSELIPIFEDIRDEENVHVGQLQKALQQVSAAADNVSKGMKEAEGQLENNLSLEVKE